VCIQDCICKYLDINLDIAGHMASVYAVYLKEREGVLKQVRNIPGRVNLTV
jgi:hypothetical protein